MLSYFSYLKFDLLVWNIELIFMFCHFFVVNNNGGKRTHASAAGSFPFGLRPQILIIEILQRRPYISV